jgi:hypothetical protein
MTGRLDTETIDRARAVQVADVIHYRRIPLWRIGLDLVGACPVCGDGERQSLKPVRRSICARTPGSADRAGDSVVDLVMHLDGVGFQEAVGVLALARSLTTVVCDFTPWRYTNGKGALSEHHPASAYESGDGRQGARARRSADVEWPR